MYTYILYIHTYIYLCLHTHTHTHTHTCRREPTLAFRPWGIESSCLWAEVVVLPMGCLWARPKWESPKWESPKWESPKCEWPKWWVYGMPQGAEVDILVRAGA